MSAVIFSGNNIKTLKRDLLFNQAGVEYAGYLMRSGVDPRVSAEAGNRGTLLVDIATGSVYKKLDTGSSTNWEKIISQGGSRLSFLELGNSPIQTVASNLGVYLFEAGLAQELYTEYKVPSTYVAGTPLTARALAYCASSSGNILLSTQSTLIRSGTDAISSTTNQRTSTNTSITLSGGTVNIPQHIIFDITSATGQINSVAISANDTILLRLYRATDTATGDIGLLYKNCEVILG